MVATTHHQTRQAIDEFISSGTIECWEYRTCEIKLANYANRNNDVILTSSTLDPRATYKENIYGIKVRLIKNTEYGSCYDDLTFYSVEATYNTQVYINQFAVSNSQ
ncbi:MAG: hypothetical protein ACLGGX_04760 [Bdellovibrionia bacterium]